MNRLMLSTFVFLWLLISCQGGSPAKGNDAKTTGVVNKGSVAKKDTAGQMQNAAMAEKSDPPFDIKSFNPDNRFNTIAAVISGVKTSAGDLKKYLDSSAWHDNMAFIDSSWKRLERSRLTKMRDWRDKELATINKNTQTLFYPFSGPDFLTAYSFFPEPDKYILIGLENIGRLPDVSKMKKTDAQDYVHGFRKSLTDIFSKSYFITKNMSRDFNYKSLYGTLSLMSFFIKRTGNEIADVKFVVRSKTEIIEVPYDYKNKAGNTPFGVRIDIVSNGKPKSIYYFKYDLSNAKFNDSAVFFKYLSKMTHSSTYIKSASYLLHNDFMTNLRKFILSKTDNVVEDDTGIPFKYFTEGAKWNIKLYGEYVRPVSDFKWLTLQKDLKDYIVKDSANIPKLPFHLGYHWASNKDILLVCNKK